MSMKPIHDVPPRELEDEELVARSRTGDVGAFRVIATRYYSLIYTMAYEATGNLNRSDDLARDTFVAAWRRLSDSREPIKLRSWLCALARELTDDYLRHRGERLTMFGTAASEDSKMAQPAASGSSAAKSKTSADQVAVEDLALQMLVAEKDQDSAIDCRFWPAGGHL